jgi:hypothetical protein
VYGKEFHHSTSPAICLGRISPCGVFYKVESGVAVEEYRELLRQRGALKGGERC